MYFVMSETQPSLSILKKSPFTSLLVDNDLESIQELICPLCKDLVREPLSCQNCEQNYCKQCLDQKFQESDTFTCTCEETFISRKPSKFLFKTLEKIQMRCPFEGEGCNLTLEYATAYSHIIKCPYYPTICQNVGCSQKIHSKDMEEHSKTCQFATEQCPFCEDTLYRVEMINHPAKCPKKPIACKYCYKLFKQESILDHSISREHP